MAIDKYANGLPQYSGTEMSEAAINESNITGVPQSDTSFPGAGGMNNGGGDPASFWSADGKFKTGIDFANALSAMGEVYLGIKNYGLAKQAFAQKQGEYRTGLANAGNENNLNIFSSLNAQRQKAIAAGRSTAGMLDPTATVNQLGSTTTMLNADGSGRSTFGQEQSNALFGNNGNTAAGPGGMASINGVPVAQAAPPVNILQTQQPQQQQAAPTNIDQLKQLNSLNTTTV
jgi:hypothetical protein